MNCTVRRIRKTEGARQEVEKKLNKYYLAQARHYAETGILPGSICPKEER